jgi:hypothetical protein
MMGTRHIIEPELPEEEGADALSMMKGRSVPESIFTNTPRKE